MVFHGFQPLKKRRLRGFRVERAVRAFTVCVMYNMMNFDMMDTRNVPGTKKRKGERRPKNLQNLG